MIGKEARTRAVPLGLTFAAAVALAVLIGLGVWQLHRLRWKQGLLAKIAALAHAPPQPIGPVLARGRAGADVDFTRVAVHCATPTLPTRTPAVFRYSLRDGQIGWRLMGICHLVGGAYDGLLIDRGLVDRFAGAMSPQPETFPEPAAVIGVLTRVSARGPFDGPAPQSHGPVTVLRVLNRNVVSDLAGRAGLRRPAPWFLAVESERPAPAGVRPAALPTDIPNNHFVYALTWFGLAAALACIYAAKLWQWLRDR